MTQQQTLMSEREDQRERANEAERLLRKFERERNALRKRSLYYNKWLRTEAQFAQLRKLIDEQAEDDGLWFVAETASEAYLQQELRRLHAAIEGSADA